VGVNEIDESASLSAVADLDGNRRVTFDQSLSFGRDATNDVVIDADSISRRHAVFEWDGSRWRVRDLNSKNGTSLNGKRVRPDGPLKPGDVLRFGSAARWKIEALAPPRSDIAADRTRTAGPTREGVSDFHLFLRFEGPGEGTILVSEGDRVWSERTEQRFLLLYLLARNAGEWVDDYDVKVGLWGVGGAHEVDVSALHKLIHDARKRLQSHGFDGWVIEKSRGRTRLALPPDRIHIQGDGE